MGVVASLESASGLDPDLTSRDESEKELPALYLASASARSSFLHLSFRWCSETLFGGGGSVVFLDLAFIYLVSEQN